jgi:DNA-directed RNA polymerase specialized sigma24 family protein
MIIKIELNYVIEHFYNKILKFFAFKLNNYTKAQDLTHDFFIHINEKEIKHTDINNFIYKAANNFYLDYCKRKENRIQLVDIETTFDYSSTSETIDTEYIKKISLNLKESDKKFLEFILNSNSLSTKDLSKNYKLSEQQILRKIKKLKKNLVDII